MNENYFKRKTKKGPINDSRKTISARHNEKLNEFAVLEKELPKKKEKLEKLKKTNDKGIEVYSKINELEKEIKSIESKELEVDYLLNVGKILFQYEELNKNKKPQTFDPFIIKSKKKTDSRNETSIKKNKKTNNEIIQYIPNKVTKSRLNEEYLKIINEGNITVVREFIYQCKRCPEKPFLIRDIKEGILVCPSCAITILDEHPDDGGYSYKEKQDISIISHYAYERISHFNDWLKRFQGKENTDIPNGLIDKLEKEIRKNKIKDKKKITSDKVRKWLKNIGESDYEHCDLITSKLSGIPSLQMNSDQEERVKQMFCEIQNAYKKHKGTRKNFLSYPYTIYKFCELLGWDNYLKCFRLLSDKKLREHDRIWKKICAEPEVNWKFYPTPIDN